MTGVLEAREPSDAYRSCPNLANTLFWEHHLSFINILLYSLSLNYLEAWPISQKSFFNNFFYFSMASFLSAEMKSIFPKQLPLLFFHTVRISEYEIPISSSLFPCPVGITAPNFHMKSVKSWPSYCF